MSGARHRHRHRPAGPAAGGPAPRHRTRATTADDLQPAAARPTPAMVRSPHAHAVIRSIDTAAALAVPGVIAVLTGSDWLARRAEADAASRRSPGIRPRSRCTTPTARRRSPRRISRCRTTRRALSARRSPSWSAETVAAREGRRRAGRGRLRAAAVRDLRARCGQARRARLLHEHHGSNVCIDAAGRRRGGDRGRIRARRARRASSRPGCRASRLADGAARGVGRIRCRRPANTRSTPATARSAGCTADLPPRSACRRRGAARDPRRRRQLRHARRRSSPSRCWWPGRRARSAGR